MTTTVLPGDWRSGAYGADRLCHLFIWHAFKSEKAPACGNRGGPKYLRHQATRSNACRECVRAAERTGDL